MAYLHCQFGGIDIKQTKTRKTVIDIRSFPVSIPVEVLSDRDLSTLESIVRYLKEEQGMTYTSIATLLKRDDRTVWTTYQRALKKIQRKNLAEALEGENPSSPNQTSSQNKFASAKLPSQKEVFK